MGKPTQEQIQDEFGVLRNKCACGEIAYWWDGEKSMCYECITKQADFKAGHIIGSNMTLEEKYGKQ